MSKKRLQLFVIYSLSLCTIISIFSAVIYFSVNVSEEERIKQSLDANITILARRLESSGFDLKDLHEYATNHGVAYSLWDKESHKQIQTNWHFWVWPPPDPAQYRELEKFEGEKVIAPKEGGEFDLLYGLTFPIFNTNIELQVIRSSSQHQGLMRSLTNVLIGGSIILWTLGILLGVMLTYLSMKPVIKAWKKQRTFVADASHELRTPLSIITLKSDHLITHSKDLIYDHLEEIAVIQQECRRMYKMVSELLFLAKSDSGVIDVTIENFSVEQLARELQMLYGEFFEMADKEFVVELNYDGEVAGDYEKIKQVCMIIIDNGLRFTKEKEYIKFATRAKGSRVYFDITNNGAALKEEDLPYIFDRFYKSDVSRNKKNNKEGNGLGLSIAQEIINGHHSRIRAYVEDGDITGFSFYLNKAK